MRKAVLLALLLAACADEPVELAYTSGKLTGHYIVTSYTVALQSDPFYNNPVTPDVLVNGVPFRQRYLSTATSGVCMQGTGMADVYDRTGNTKVKCVDGDGSETMYRGPVSGSGGLIVPYRHVAAPPEIELGSCILLASSNPRLNGYKLVMDRGGAIVGNRFDCFIGPQFMANVGAIGCSDENATLLGISPPGAGCPAPGASVPHQPAANGLMQPVPNAMPILAENTFTAAQRTPNRGSQGRTVAPGKCQNDHSVNGQPVTCDEFVQVDGVCDCGCKDYRTPSGQILNEGVPDIDCFVGEACDGLDLNYSGWCGGHATTNGDSRTSTGSADPNEWNVLTWCQGGIVRQAICDEPPYETGRTCACESETVGWNCWPPRGVAAGAGAPAPADPSVCAAMSRAERPVPGPVPLMSAPPPPRPGAQPPMMTPGSEPDVAFFRQTQMDWSGGASDQFAICGPRLAALFSDAVGRPLTANEARKMGNDFGIYFGGGIESADRFDEYVTYVIRTANPGSTAFVTQEDAGSNAQTTQIAAASLRAGAGIVGFNGSNHYFGATKYDEATGRFFIGGTGTTCVGGREWMTVDEMESLGCIRGNGGANINKVVVLHR